MGLLPDTVVIKEEVNKLADIYFDGVSECFMGCLMIIIYDVPEPSDGSLVWNYDLTGNKITSIAESSQINLRFFISNPIISLFTVHDPFLTVSQCSQPVYDVSRLYPLSYQLVFLVFVLLSVILHIGTVPPANNNDYFTVAKIHPALTSSTSLKIFHKITNFHLKLSFCTTEPATSLNNIVVLPYNCTRYLLTLEPWHSLSARTWGLCATEVPLCNWRLVAAFMMEARQAGTPETAADTGKPTLHLARTGWVAGRPTAWARTLWA